MRGWKHRRGMLCLGETATLFWVCEKIFPNYRASVNLNLQIHVRHTLLQMHVFFVKLLCQVNLGSSQQNKNDSIDTTAI